ncbi:MAG: biopolymer transporter ExbD [Sandaracinaceae bacterium]|jgi:biopolymer transport protein ExbD|nr:biopolymer transporter ExbD [Sandaracinaceae bacterium]
MGGGAQKDDDEMITAINVTPLVDVVLVLLIILMVTASYIASRSIPMDLPTASGEGTPPRTLAISIDAEGQLYLDAEALNEETLRSRVQQYAHDTQEADRRAAIAADARVSHGQVVHIIDLLRRNGVNHFAINVRPEDLQ